MPTAWTELDLFEVWRRILGIICTVYALVVLGQSVLRWTRCLQEDDNRVGRLARRYVLVRLLGVRLRRYWPDLLHIAGLLLILAALLYAHRWIPHHG